MTFNYVRDDTSSKKTDFTVDLIWWSWLRLTPIKDSMYTSYIVANYETSTFATLKIIRVGTELIVNYISPRKTWLCC